MKRIIAIICLLFLFGLLSACAVGPNYCQPVAITPVAYKEAKGRKVMGKYQHWKVAEPADAFDRGAWWHIFNDKRLDKLEHELNICNQKIAIALANYREACELVNEAGAGFFPTLGALYSFTRHKGAGTNTNFITTSGTNTTSGTAVTGGVGTQIFTTHSYLASATWEPDIWGVVRRTVEAATAGAQASAALIAVTRLSAQASLAQFYFAARALDADQKLLNETVVAYKKALRLTRNQYRAGIVSRVDVIQAQQQLENAESQAINVGINRAIYEHAIAVLIGRPPGNFGLRFNPLNRLPPPIPLEVPTVLLERRPDIAQAERLVAQANANIGLAIGAFFPTLTLTAFASVFATGNIFSIPFVTWGYGPQIAGTIYDGGLRIATVRANEAKYQATVANYRQVVLAAFKDVEDNLATLRILSNQAVPANKAARDARKALNFVMNQYKAGLLDYTAVIVAQNNAYNAEKTAIDITGFRMLAAVGLIKALGGGWDNCTIRNA